MYFQLVKEYFFILKLTLEIKKGRKFMQLNLTTDYAIRTVLFLRNPGIRRTAKEISEEMCIPKTYLIKVLTKLRKSGVITSISGHTGGYRLEKNLSEISVGEIFGIMERTMKIHHCLEKKNTCDRKHAEICSVHKFYEAVQEDIETRWLSVSLQDILDNYGKEKSL